MSFRSEDWSPEGDYNGPTVDDGGTATNDYVFSPPVEKVLEWEPVLVEQVATPAQPPMTPATVPLPPAYEAVVSTAADPRHVFVGNDWRGDVWQVVDEGGNVIEWATPPGAPSTDVIPLSVANLGPVSVMTVAQAPVMPVLSFLPGAGDKIPDDKAHVYQGYDKIGDIYSMTDAAGNLVTWHVALNDDSRNAIPSTIGISPPKTPTGIAAPSSPISAVKPTGDGSTTKTPANTLGVPGGVLINPAVPVNTLTTATYDYSAPIQTDARHKYVGRQGSTDYWQIYDGTNVIEWQVKAGDESGRIIAGTARNLGPPSDKTIAGVDGTTTTAPLTPIAKIPGATTAAQSTGSGVTVVAVLGVVASLIGAFK